MLGIHRNRKYFFFFEIQRGILEGRTEHGHPGTFWEIAKMALCIFWGPNDFIWSAMKVPFIDFIQNMSQFPSKSLSERILMINWVISSWISKNIFVLGSYEFLAMLEDKIRKGFSFRVQSGKITVWPLKVLNDSKLYTNGSSTFVVKILPMLVSIPIELVKILH